MNKRIACAFVALTVFLAAVSAQSFLDNQYQKAGREYEKQARESMDSGEYDEATKLADLAAEEYRKSREYADMMALKYRAANAINLAERRIAEVATAPGSSNFKTEIATARALVVEAKALFAAESWEESRSKALQAIDAMNKITGVKTAPRDATGKTLPKFYTVVSRPVNTDCFWNISKMRAVYNNPLLWPLLYKANKDKLRNPENPNLLHPGTVLEIPSAKGETRDGAYDPAVTYEPIE